MSLGSLVTEQCWRVSLSFRGPHVFFLVEYNEGILFIFFATYAWSLCCSSQVKEQRDMSIVSKFILCTATSKQPINSPRSGTTYLAGCGCSFTHYITFRVNREVWGPVGVKMSLRSVVTERSWRASLIFEGPHVSFVEYNQWSSCFLCHLCISLLLSSAGHTCLKLEVYTTSGFGSERWNRMYSSNRVKFKKELKNISKCFCPEIEKNTNCYF